MIEKKQGEIIKIQKKATAKSGFNKRIYRLK